MTNADIGQIVVGAAAGIFVALNALLQYYLFTRRNKTEVSSRNAQLEFDNAIETQKKSSLFQQELVANAVETFRVQLNNCEDQNQELLRQNRALIAALAEKKRR